MKYLNTKQYLTKSPSKERKFLH